MTRPTRSVLRCAMRLDSDKRLEDAGGLLRAFKRATTGGVAAPRPTAARQ